VAITAGGIIKQEPENEILDGELTISLSALT